MSGVVVHCITNTVTAARVADAIAALGAAPIMASAPEEVADVARAADALVLNCGTPSAERFAAIRAAAAVARAAGHPIVLDPVGCGGSEWRTRCIRELARHARPDVVRGNAAELRALAAIADGPDLRGVGSAAADRDTVRAIARSAAAALGAVVLVTGHGHDVLSDGRAEVDLANGGPVPSILGRIVGGGDVLSAIIAVHLARGAAPSDAARAAHAAFAAAARAGAAAGPGSFWPMFIDALAADG